MYGAQDEWQRPFLDLVLQQLSPIRGPPGSFTSTYSSSCARHAAAKRSQTFTDVNGGGKGPAGARAGGQRCAGTVEMPCSTPPARADGSWTAPAQRDRPSTRVPSTRVPSTRALLPQLLSSGRRTASALSSYHGLPQYPHLSFSPHRRYFDFWNSSYLPRGSKYIPDNFLSSFLIISFSLKLVFENMYWDDRLFISADRQYSSHPCPNPRNTRTFITVARHQF